MIHQCIQCSKTFPVGEDDLQFYDRISPVIGGKKFPVPAPTHCPDCRLQRRLALRNERTLYSRKCDLCERAMIAQYPADSEYTVYCTECYWSDKWDATDYARDFDFAKPFFEQFDMLQKAVPAVGLTNVSGTLENSEYVNYCGEVKNGYLCFAANWHENCMYGGYIWECKDSVDCSFSTNLELCYECMDSNNLYNCKYMLQSQNSNNCILGIGLRGCSDCFGSVNLQNKQFHFFNEPLEPEEYKRRVAEIMSDESAFAEAQKKFADFSLQFPRKHSYQVHCENSTGDGIKNCVNAENCFDGYDSENMKRIMNFAGGVKDCQDIFGTAKTELSYESHGLYLGYHQLFNNSLFNGGSNSMYCAFSSGDSLFGCVGLQKGTYAILNQQYSKVEYEALMQKILTHMQETKEWGEFFPIAISPFAYNTTVASNYFPLKKEDILNNDWKYREPDELISHANAKQCEACQRNFNIVEQEKVYYTENGIFEPKLCHNCRYDKRIASRKERALWKRQCMCTQPDHAHPSTGSGQVARQCATEFETTYSPERKELVYCEACFQTEII